MDDSGFEVHEEPNKLTFIVKPQGIDPFAIINRMQPFLRCHSGCFDDITASQPTRANPYFSEPERVLDQLRGLSINQPVPAQEKPINSSHVSLLSLPTEIFLETFSLVVERYNLAACIWTTGWGVNPPKHLVFRSPRTWKSMSIFHVSRLFRYLAIARYGQPRQYSLPFDPVFDKLVIEEAGKFKQDFHPLDEFKDMGDNGSFDPEWVVWNGKNWYHLVLNRFYYGVSMPDTEPIHEFLKRIRRAEITILNDSTTWSVFTNPDSWGFMIACMNLLLPNLKELGITMWEYDDCASQQKAVAPAYAFKEKHAWFFLAFCCALNQHKPELRTPLFPLLERLELVKLGHRCSLLSQRPEGMGEMLFNSEEGNKWCK
ncbi:hypothetical protein F4677DRAFT_465675 [Hypoxylon crocopeplum]|nr:hypothetical protein F4677DRAFT_465675 [Hypoxylon crocopeplum]